MSIAHPNSPRTARPREGSDAPTRDGKLFAEMLQELGPGLRRHLQRRLGSVDAAEDAVQETLLRMLRYREIRDAGEIRALLFRVARSVVADHVQYASTRCVSAHCALDDHDLTSNEPSPDRTLAGQQDLDLLKHAILALPPRCREVFLLHRFDGLSYRDIAHRFGTSERTVENQIAHALAVCRRALA